MAPRILHCSNRQLYWECPSKVCCETFPNGLLELLWVMDDLFQMRRLLAAPAVGYARLNHGTIGSQTGVTSVHREIEAVRAPMTLSHQTWQRTVEMYTQCKLTYPKDKLIAISGIAEAFQPSLGTYRLGLWEDHLPMGLLWSLADPPSLTTTQGLAAGPQRDNKPPYRAPSWSWASVDGPVRFLSNPFARSLSPESNVFSTVIDVLDVDTRTRHLNGLGEVMPRTRASLILEGGLVPVELGLRVTRANDGSVRGSMLIVSVGDEEYAHYANHPASGSEQELEMDRMLTLLLGGSAMEVTGRTHIQEQTSVVALDDIPAAILASASGELWCLPILVKDFFGVWSVDGILLARSSDVPVPAKDRGLAVYQRVGYFSACGQESPGLRMFQGLEREPILII